MQARRTGRKNIARRSTKQSRADEHLSFRDTADPGTPSARGLYDPALDKDSCGVGFVADLKGRESHKIIDDGLTILLNLEHRDGHRCKYAPNIDPTSSSAHPVDIVRIFRMAEEPAPTLSQPLMKRRKPYWIKRFSQRGRRSILCAILHPAPPKTLAGGSDGFFGTTVSVILLDSVSVKGQPKNNRIANAKRSVFQSNLSTGALLSVPFPRSEACRAKRNRMPTRHPRRTATCVYRKLDSAIMVVKAAEDRLGCDGAEVLNRTMDRSVLAQRPIGPCLIIQLDNMAATSSSRWPTSLCQGNCSRRFCG